MTADARDYTLEISEALFRLTTESIRLRSNETCSHESLSSLTRHLAGADRDVAAQDADILRHHLNVVPAKGNITVDLVLSESSADMLETLTACYEDLVARQLTTEDIISLLLFDYVAERKTARILGTLGLRRLGSRQRGGGNTSSSH